MSEKKFIGGLLVKAPNQGAPSYVIAKLSIKREELIAWLQTEHGEWINADIKTSQGGKWYASVDDWKPNQAKGQSVGNKGHEYTPEIIRDQSHSSEAFVDDDLPF